MNSLLGDQPVKTIIKLILMSLVVGFILKILHITPIGLFEWLVENIAHIINISFDSFETVIGYIATGAIIVVPLWIFKRSSDKKHDANMKDKYQNKYDQR